MRPMHYKGYAARIEYSDEDQLLVGRVAGIHDVLTFHATNVNDLRRAFRGTVDDYLAFCEKLGREPQRPFSGKVMLRIDPALHARAAAAAEAQGKSLNQWAAEQLRELIGDR